MTDLDKLDELAARATQGEWVVTHHTGWWDVTSGEYVAFDDGSGCGEYNDECSVETRDHIVALHNSYPAISAELRAARAQLATIRAETIEECARVCERECAPWESIGSNAASVCAAAIRALPGATVKP